MLRPRLRPTLSRKTKYWGIAPTAQNKLGREARRGSHDLRRLVGHANFLDVLIDQLDMGEEKEDDAVTPTGSKDVVDNRIEEEEEAAASEEDSGENSWSDEEDDEDLSLSRTISHTASSQRDEVYAQIQRSLGTDGSDYFQLSKPDGGPANSFTGGDNGAAGVRAENTPANHTNKRGQGNETTAVSPAERVEKVDANSSETP